MKRYHNKRCRSDWHLVATPHKLLGRWPEFLSWCQSHEGARFHYSTYTGFWFEDRQDAELFSANITFLLLQHE